MKDSNKIKVGIVCICLNQSYWEFSQEMLWGLDTFFLKHPSIRDKYRTDMLLWTDMPEPDDSRFFEQFKQSHEALQTPIDKYVQLVNDAKSFLTDIRARAKIFPTEPIEWPMPTLMRYHLFLQQKEDLLKYDYIFYVDVDMKIVDWIGEEVLGDGLTAALHPMYALRRNLQPPYEPNKESEAYIPHPGRIVEENGQKRFEQEYYAGGFQGGKRKDFIRAMKTMRNKIEKDFSKNYIARWNDESHWNRYLFDNAPAVVLGPSYIYPDSLIDSYYIKLWGRNYSPKIMTLTKKFSTSKEAGQAVQAQLATM